MNKINPVDFLKIILQSIVAILLGISINFLWELKGWQSKTDEKFLNSQQEILNIQEHQKEIEQDQKSDHEEIVKLSEKTNL
jgi:hypothetical protein